MGWMVTSGDSDCQSVDQYIYEIKHAANIPEKSKDFPNELIKKWVYKDLCEILIRIGGVINQRYKHTAVAQIDSLYGLMQAAVNHTADAVTVSGFSGLTADEFENGGIIHIGDSKTYYAKIYGNDETTITLDNGSALPAISSGTVILTKCSSGGTIDLLSLNGIDNGDMVWHVRECHGKAVKKITAQLARNITNMPDFNNTVFWYQEGTNLRIVVGAETKWSGFVDIGYYRRPFPFSADSDCVELPTSYVVYAQALTIIRILNKKGLAGDQNAMALAATLERSLRLQINRIIKGQLSIKSIDWHFREVLA